MSRVALPDLKTASSLEGQVVVGHERFCTRPELARIAASAAFDLAARESPPVTVISPALTPPT